MKTLGIIPARFGATRFPGKPLADIGGKTLLQRVYEQATQANLYDLLVATDDERIAAHARSLGAKVCLTSPEHASGTDRCAEALAWWRKQGQDCDVVINIQGDEPFVAPEQLHLLQNLLKDHTSVQLASLCKAITEPVLLHNPNVVKVVLAKPSHQALYFSRQALPFVRGKAAEDWLNYGNFYKHLGLYAYRPEALLALSQLAPSSLEQLEGLEQLRWLEAGWAIQMGITTQESIGVDVPEDVQRCLDWLAKEK
jgi:3-deoxy-manno-octulosonate cytidylyltransferase (CMP-KDO synthetase)